MIVVFPEQVIYRYLRVGKRALAEVFRKFGQNDHLMIIIMVTKIQSFYSRMSSANLEYKRMFLATCSEEGSISTEDLRRAVQMVKGSGKQIKLVSDREIDFRAAEALGASFILLGNKSTTSQISTTVKDLTLLPNILGLNQTTINKR